MSVLDAKQSRPLEGGPSFSLSNRLVRALWMVTWGLLASWTPAPLHRYRVALLRLFGAKVDWTARVYGSARIWLPSNLEMRAHSCLGPEVHCYCLGPIVLGERAVVSQGARLCAGTHDIHDRNFQLIAKPIVVGDGAWIAAEAFLGPGAIVGSDAVVGARAVLFGEAESSGVYIGNPASKVGDRYPRLPE
jgi:putative colanic acid biosynthesis acetyltransferase WcaF